MCWGTQKDAKIEKLRQKRNKKGNLRKKKQKSTFETNKMQRPKRCKKSNFEIKKKQKANLRR